MKFGLLADIHGDIANLKYAIGRLEREKVDLFVALGDVINDHRNASETVAMLKLCGAIGVWGNHELGLCVDPQSEVCQRFDDTVTSFLGTFKSRLEFGGVLFSHTLPILDASDPLSYYLGQRPDDEGAMADCFAQYHHQIVAVGHFHRWFAATPLGRLEWDGNKPIQLDARQRYFFVVNAVKDGYAAVLDMERLVLEPICFRSH